MLILQPVEELQMRPEDYVGKCPDSPSRKHTYMRHQEICMWCRRAQADIELSGMLELARWRDADSELPAHAGRYLVAASDGEAHVEYYSMREGWVAVDAGITHWRPIGPMPETGGVPNG